MAAIIQPNTIPMDRYPIRTGRVYGKAAAKVFRDMDNCAPLSVMVRKSTGRRQLPPRGLRALGFRFMTVLYKIARLLTRG